MIDRKENLPIPLIPCPLVQPPLILVPIPTNNPATINKGKEFEIEILISLFEIKEQKIGPKIKPTKNKTLSILLSF